MLSGFESHSGNLLMRTYWGQVHDHFNLRVCHHGIDRAGRQTVSGGFLLCSFKVPRTYGLNAKVIKLLRHVFQIDITDDAGTDNADTDRIFHKESLL